MGFLPCLELGQAVVEEDVEEGEEFVLLRGDDSLEFE
jgi:hypothetical protein